MIGEQYKLNEELKKRRINFIDKPFEQQFVPSTEKDWLDISHAWRGKIKVYTKIVMEKPYNLSLEVSEEY